MHRTFNQYSIYIPFFHKSGKLLFTKFLCINEMKGKEKGGASEQQLKTINKTFKKIKINQGCTMISDSKNHQVITATKQEKQGQICPAENLKPVYTLFVMPHPPLH